MDFKSVLFSKEHIISPFEMNYQNKNLSIEDKKIKTIALSILVGIFTAGIGGIILFYCLSARYKLEKLNSHIAEIFTENKQTAVSKEDQEYIHNFVASFLHPYITNKIRTKVSERKCMIELLQEKMPGYEPSKKSAVEEIALDAFFEKAAFGLYVNQKKRSHKRDITPGSSKSRILVCALAEALPREFPDRVMSMGELKKKAFATLNDVNKQRKLAREEIFNPQVKRVLDLRYTKLCQLQNSGELFLK